MSRNSFWFEFGSERAGQPASLLAAAELPEANSAPRAETERARDLGVFGAPGFVVGTELFRGDDRLEAALAQARASTERIA